MEYGLVAVRTSFDPEGTSFDEAVSKMYQLGSPLSADAIPPEGSLLRMPRIPGALNNMQEKVEAPVSVRSVCDPPRKCDV